MQYFQVLDTNVASEQIAYLMECSHARAFNNIVQFFSVLFNLFQKIDWKHFNISYINYTLIWVKLKSILYLHQDQHSTEETWSLRSRDIHIWTPCCSQPPQTPVAVPLPSGGWIDNQTMAGHDLLLRYSCGLNLFSLCWICSNHYCLKRF